MNRSQRQIEFDYPQRGIYTFPETTDANYCVKGDVTCSTLNGRPW